MHRRDQHQTQTASGTHGFGMEISRPSMAFPGANPVVDFDSTQTRPLKLASQRRTISRLGNPGGGSTSEDKDTVKVPIWFRLLVALSSGVSTMVMLDQYLLGKPGERISRGSVAMAVKSVAGVGFFVLGFKSPIGSAAFSLTTNLIGRIVTTYGQDSYQKVKEASAGVRVAQLTRELRRGSATAKRKNEIITELKQYSAAQALTRAFGATDDQITEADVQQRIALAQASVRGEIAELERERKVIRKEIEKSIREERSAVDFGQKDEIKRLRKSFQRQLDDVDKLKRQLLNDKKKIKRKYKYRPRSAPKAKSGPTLWTGDYSQKEWSP